MPIKTGKPPRLHPQAITAGKDLKQKKDNMDSIQFDLFPDLKVRRTRASKEYGDFTDKFKRKLTTDDCYTPEPVYKAVLDWCIEKYGLQGREIVRPFWPGGDFEKYDYPENCVVIANPPFSIYDHILDFYTNERPTDFFIFGPALTLFKKYDACYVICNENVTYANGAVVKTSFATNLDSENRVACYTDLNNAIHHANEQNKPKKEDLPVIKYPCCIVTSALLGKTSRVDFAFRREDCEFITKLNDRRIFGSSFLLSDRAAADRAAADRAAARRTIVQELDENAKAILKRLNKNT